MSAMDPVELAVAEWLTDEAAYHLPDHLGEVVTATAATRQRPAWSSLERWLPMDISTRASTLAPPRLGRAIVVALLIVALVALGVVVVGSRQHRVPPPFGPARNGELLSSANGDIFRIDPVTLQRTPLITGDTNDFGPTFSRDGTRFMFLRGRSDCGKPDCGLELVVANADGSGVRQLTPGVQGLDAADWSPDGSQIAYETLAPNGHGHVIDIVNVDGSATRTLDVGRPAHELAWLPPDGKEIVFRVEHLDDNDPPAGIFAVRPDGTGLHLLTTRPPFDGNDFEMVSLSPDGSQLGYMGDDGPDGHAVSHILDLRTMKDRSLPQPGGDAALGPFFSPDGRLVAYQRFVAMWSNQLIVAPADGSSVGLPLGSYVPYGQDGPGLNNCSWTPDGTAVICNDDSEKVARLFPIDGSTPVDIAHGQLAFANYQRLAP